jgi:hypothetical protein
LRVDFSLSFLVKSLWDLIESCNYYRVYINIFESFFEFVFESIFESGHKVVELRSAPEQRTDLILYGRRAFTDVYYSFIPKPLNLIIFSKKLKNYLLFLKEKRQ